MTNPNVWLRTPLRIFTSVTILISFTSPLVHHSTIKANTASTRTIIREWDRREQLTRSFDIQWEGIEFRSSRCILDHLLYGDITADPPEREDASFEVDMRFLVSAGGQARLEYYGHAWCPTRERYMPRVEIDSFDGHVRRTYFPVDVSIDYPTLHITRRDAGAVGGDQRLLPVRLVFRPFDSSIGVFKRGEIQLTQRKGVVDGTSCIILTHSDGEIWVDAARNYIPIRYITMRGDSIWHDLRITYVADGQHAWRPDKWSAETFGTDGELIRGTYVKVTTCDLNVTTTDDMFQDEYPLGTWVQDNISDETYIIRRDGRRPVLAGEFDGTNYEQLLRTDPRGRGVVMIMLSGFAVLIAVGGWLLYLQWRRAF